MQQAAEQIRELFLFTMLTDSELRDAISKRTGGNTQTRARWIKFRSLVDQIVDGTVAQPRFFSFEFRTELWNDSHTCALCHNEIHTFEDATVDHKTPFSKGGKTVPDKCNCHIAVATHARTRRFRSRPLKTSLENVPWKKARMTRRIAGAMDAAPLRKSSTRVLSPRLVLLSFAMEVLRALRVLNQLAE